MYSRSSRLQMSLSLAAMFLAASQSIAVEAIRFNRDIRPILSDYCFACHGFDAKKREAELRLDVAEGAFADRPEGPAIVPGQLEASAVWQRLVSEDPDLQMPPPHLKKNLSNEQKERLRRWIEQGADYEKHWAFEPPIVTPPASTNDQLVDAYLGDRLGRERLVPRLEANRETLIRRLSFALTGLSPTVEEVDRFLADTSLTAYEELVDRYLSSPSYGEEMARHWLDVARYADTHGLHLDNERQMWAYRDWVIRAFNENLPFDQFTLWQLAGDLLPTPTNDQMVATGFSRCNVTTSEGGAIDDEYRYLYAVDRTSTMIETWMGLTGGCAVCHDHKFDPLSNTEFFSLYAFFNSAADPPMDKNIARTTPFLKLPTSDEQAAVEEAERRVENRLQALRQIAAESEYTDPADELVDPLQGEIREVEDIIFDDVFPYGATAKSTTRNPSNWDLQPLAGVPAGMRSLKQISSYFTEDTFDLGVSALNVPQDAMFSIWVCPDPTDTPRVLALSIKQAGEHLVYWGEKDPEQYGVSGATQGRHMGELPTPGEWTELKLSAADMGLKSGDAVANISLQQSGGIVWWDRFRIYGRSQLADDPRSSFQAWWKVSTKKNFAELPKGLAATLKAGPDKAQDLQARRDLLAFYLAHVARPVNSKLEQQRVDWEQALAAREVAEARIIGTMIFRDEVEPRPSFVMERGQYNRPTTPVKPDVPSVLPPLLRDDSPANATRLDLARWLVDPGHPLTARVTVNRFWQQFFGTGLVKTSHDFGSQGEPPSHPELLDWLSVQFRQSGWDVKSLVRLLVVSEAFRRDSTIETEIYQRDPDNRFYARGPRFRLDAEQIRDSALWVSGLLSPRRGGRGSLPYQPPNIWEPVGYQNSNTRYYLQGHGDDLYRRSIYCFLKRTAPPPFMSNFDGPNREQFCTRRERSNTPLQALQLMNDVQHFEAARGLAERVLGGNTQDGVRLRAMFRLVVARLPDEKEQRLLGEALHQQRVYYRSRAFEAAQVMTQGESKPKRIVADDEGAAWTMVANLILNLDESVTRN